MRSFTVSLLGGAVLFGTAAHALVFPGPRPTGGFLAAQVHGAEESDDWTPKPTPGPDLHEVLRRQSNKAYTFLAAPDNTCGYRNGREVFPYGCDPESKCAFITATGKEQGAVGCCSDKTCAFRRKCFDEDDMDSCDKNCLADPETLKCTRRAARFCNTLVFPTSGLGGLRDYYCGGSRARNVVNVETTHAGEKTRVLTKSVVGPSQTTERSPATRTSSSKASSSTVSSESGSDENQDFETQSSDPLPEPSSIETNTAATAASTATESAAPAVAPAGGSKSDVGAIVGGIIGGLAVIALIALGFFFLRRQKKKGEAPTTVHSAIPPQQPPQMYEQPPHPPSQPPSQPPAVSPFADPPQYAQYQSVPPPLVLYQASPTSASQRPTTPSRFSPVSATTIAALAAIPDTVKKPLNYPGPSPMSTPSGSPKPTFQSFPQTSYYPNQPQYRPSPTSSTAPHMRDYSEASQVDIQQAWVAPVPPSREESNSPSSAFNAFPVSPVSALGSHPPEHHHIGVPGVPLILQPGLGMQRLPPGTVRQVTVQRGASRRGQNPLLESQTPQSSSAG